MPGIGIQPVQKLCPNCCSDACELWRKLLCLAGYFPTFRDIWEWCECVITLFLRHRVGLRMLTSSYHSVPWQCYLSNMTVQPSNISQLTLTRGIPHRHSRCHSQVHDVLFLTPDRLSDDLSSCDFRRLLEYLPTDPQNDPLPHMYYCHLCADAF